MAATDFLQIHITESQCSMSNPSEATQTRILTVCLLILTTIAIAFSIYWLRPVLVPFVVAIFVVSGLAPILDMLEKRLHVNRLIAAGIAFLLGLIILMLLFRTIWLSVAEINSYADDYIFRFQEIRSNIEDMMISLEFKKPDQKMIPANDSAQEGTNLFDTLLDEGVSQVTDTLLNLLSQSVVVLIYVFFLLLGAAEKMTPNSTWKEIDEQIRSYLFLKTNISIITGAAFGLALWFFGIPMAITFGVLAFLLNYIPNIGPLVASVLPIPLIVLHPDPNLLWMIGVIGVTVSIQFLSGNVIEPKIMGNSSDMHPVVVLLALMFWGMLWGIVGMFLATPITAGIKIVLERIEVTKPIAVVMAGRWPEGDEGSHD